MRIACEYVDRMATLYVRNVPKDIHQALQAKAAMSGSTLSDFLRAELAIIAQRPSICELRKRLRQREPVCLKPTAAEVIREWRDQGLPKQTL